MTPTSSHDHMKLGDHDHQFQVLGMKTKPSQSSVSTHNLSYSDIQDQGSYYEKESYQLKFQQEANNFALEGGSSNDRRLKLCLWKNDDGQKNQISVHHRHKEIPTKWLPSKLRFVRKMMGSDRMAASEKQTNHKIKMDEYHDQGSSPMITTENSTSSKVSTTPIRVCSDCNTTKTPLWRSGPRGPKSLCNACGIRQRKARRALAAAAAAANGTTLAVEGTKLSKPYKVQQKEKKLKINSGIATCKKRSKLSNINGRKNKACFEEFLISLSKNLAFQQVFPQDEKEAAILLMALSCNLVHG